MARKSKKKVMKGQTKTIKGKTYKLGKTSRWESTMIQQQAKRRKSGRILAGVGAGVYVASHIIANVTGTRLAGIGAPVGFAIGVLGLARSGSAKKAVRTHERKLMIEGKSTSTYRKDMVSAGFKTYHERTLTPRKMKREHRKIIKLKRKMGRIR